jgi:hypothetical protein
MAAVLTAVLALTAFFGSALPVNAAGLADLKSLLSGGGAKEKEMEEEKEKGMVERSLVQTGNVFRLKKAIEKARNGEDVTIAYIGGSITEGASASVHEKSYAYASFKEFSKLYAKDTKKMHYVNAGMSGTPSSLGIMRYQRDVLEAAETAPDIVVIEFAVNDNNEATKSKAFEGMVRNILNAENAPAVILMFSVFQNGLWNMQSTYIPIGEAYGLPMVSIKDAISPEITSGAMKNEDFFASDGWHPLDFGHQIMTDCMVNLFKNADAAREPLKDAAFPKKPVYGADYENLLVLDRLSANEYDGVTLTEGSFSETDTITGSFAYSKKQKLPDNFKHGKNSGSQPLTVKLTCKNFLFSYKLSSAKNTLGKAEIYVDGELVKTVNGYNAGGWNNPETIEVFNNEEAAEHTVEIRMAKDSENLEFTVLLMGFSV